MKSDPVICGALAGIIGTLAKEIVDFLSVTIGWSKYLYWNLAASVFVLPKDVHQPGALIIGGLADIIVGSFWGIVLFYIIKFSGRSYSYIKGLGIGWLIWLSLFGAVVNLHVVRITPTDIGTTLSAFVEHSAFGLTATWFINQFADSTSRR